MNGGILPKRLKELREKNGFKQNFVADKLGIRSNTLSGYENGNRSPDPDMLVALSELYNVTVDYLLGKSDNRDLTEDNLINSIKEKIAKEFPEADLMFNDLSNMNAEQLEDVYDFIKYKLSKKGD